MTIASVTTLQAKQAVAHRARPGHSGRADDFSRHNPIHRWWGGTELTNDRLWRWDAVKQILAEP